MGYTHYFRTKKTTDEKWSKIIKDCQKLISNMPKIYKGQPLLIDDQEGGKPVLNDKKILFNGTDKDFVYGEDNYPDLSHETFMLEKEPRGHQPDENGLIFNFCKTAAKPYDLMVCACLLVYKHHSPDTIKLSSDGSKSDWLDAEQLVRDTLGYNVDSGLEK
jgi:hypothetical protein